MPREMPRRPSCAIFPALHQRKPVQPTASPQREELATVRWVEIAPVDGIEQLTPDWVASGAIWSIAPDSGEPAEIEHPRPLDDGGRRAAQGCRPQRPEGLTRSLEIRRVCPAVAKPPPPAPGLRGACVRGDRTVDRCRHRADHCSGPTGSRRNPWRGPANTHL
jgi:hypothetical protein